MAKLSQVKIEPVAMDELNLFWTNNIMTMEARLAHLTIIASNWNAFGASVAMSSLTSGTIKAAELKKQQGQRIEIQAWQHLLWIQRQSTRSCQTRSNDIEEVDCRSRDLSLLQIPNGEELFQVLTGPPPQSWFISILASSSE